MNTISTILPQLPLGTQGLMVGAQGLGTMGMTSFYQGFDNISEEDKINTIGAALDLGVNMLDTAWMYQDFKTGATNEALVGKALAKFGREKFIVATKFGVIFRDMKVVESGKPEDIRSQCDDSLKRLGIDCIDLYYMHRMDPNTPIEETMKCLLELKNEGKIKYVGLSECTPEELERAHKVMPISAIEMEWSLQSRDIENTILPVARRLGIGIVCYSPLGRGFLSRTFTKKEELQTGDYRASQPRFNEENFDENAKCAQKLEEFAKARGYSAAQIALGWLHSRGKDVFPIPGTKTTKRVVENSAAFFVKLSDEEWQEVGNIVPTANGERYDEKSIKRTFNNRDI